MGYATVEAVSDGQGDNTSTFPSEYYEIKEDIETPCKRENKKYGEIFVKKAGFYSLKMYTSYKAVDDNFSGSYGKFFKSTLTKGYVQEGETIYFYDNITTIENVMSIADPEDPDIITERRYSYNLHHRAKAIFYLKKNRVYRLIYYVGSNTNVSDFKLLLQPNADQYQYDSETKNVNTKYIGEFPKMQVGLITQKYTQEDMDRRTQSIKLNDSQRNASRLCGTKCALSWTISEDFFPDDPEENIHKMTSNIYYVDQELGAFIRTTADELYHYIDIRERVKNNINNLINGTIEAGIGTVASTAVGAFSTAAGAGVGFFVSILFLVLHAINDKSILQELSEKILPSKNNYYERLDYPVKMTFQFKKLVQVNERKHSWDPPGPPREVITKITRYVEVEEWDGKVISAVGEKYKYGNFEFSHYSTNELNEIYRNLKS